MTRRVVTGTDASGRSCILSDREVTSELMWFGVHGQYSHLLDLDSDPQLTNGIEGPDSGYIFMSLELPPDEVLLPMFAAGGIPGHDQNGFHQSRTVDLVVVVEGQLVSLQEDGEVVLNPGDCLIQRGTNHTWRNPGDKPVKFVAVAVNDR